MLPTMTPRTEELAARVGAFMDEHVYPAEPVFARQLEGAADRWGELPVMAELKAKGEGRRPLEPVSAQAPLSRWAQQS